MLDDVMWRIVLRMLSALRQLPDAAIRILRSDNYFLSCGIISLEITASVAERIRNPPFPMIPRIHRCGKTAFQFRVPWKFCAKRYLSMICRNKSRAGKQFSRVFLGQTNNTLRQTNNSSPQTNNTLRQTNRSSRKSYNFFLLENIDSPKTNIDFRKTDNTPPRTYYRTRDINITPHKTVP
jgi:hypothetical protein